MNENNEFGLKELYDLTLKATYPIEVSGRTFQTGEVIARFDKIQLANFREVTRRVTANGGYDNRVLVVWEDPKEIQLNFTQGIFSAKQFQILCNARSVMEDGNDCFKVPKHLETESNEYGVVRLGCEKVSEVFVYDAKTGEKIEPESIDNEEGTLVIADQYRDIDIDFNFCYQEPYQRVILGRKFIQGYLQLEGKSRVKDDITGRVRTAILRIPRLKLVSDLSMRLGREATPVSANFQAIGLPVGGKGSKTVMELFFLNDDIDADM